MDIKVSRRILFLILAAVQSMSLSANKAEAQVGKRSYKQVLEFITETANRYPQNAKIFDLGPNNSGQMIKGLAIGNGSLHNMVVATHHGNEYGSTAVALGFALHLAENPIPGQTVYVIPVLNIPGFDKSQRQEPVSGQTLDPNRDYPGPCATSGPFKLKSTYYLAQFAEKMNIVASATLHTFYPGVLYPWGLSTPDLSTPYDDLFIALGKEAASVSGYKVGNSTIELYPADGTFEDYAFWKHGIWSLLFEMGNSHSPSNQAVQQLIDVNVPGLRKMFEKAPKRRADNHEFKGRCDVSMKQFDLRIE